MWPIRSIKKSRKNKLTVLDIYNLQILKAVKAQFYQKLLLRADWIIPYIKKKCKVYNPLQPFEVSDYNFFAISSNNNQKNCQFHSLTHGLPCQP